MGLGFVTILVVIFLIRNKILNDVVNVVKNNIVQKNVKRLLGEIVINKNVKD